MSLFCDPKVSVLHFFGDSQLCLCHCFVISHHRFFIIIGSFFLCKLFFRAPKCQCFVVFFGPNVSVCHSLGTSNCYSVIVVRTDVSVCLCSAKIKFHGIQYNFLLMRQVSKKVATCCFLLPIDASL